MQKGENYKVKWCLIYIWILFWFFFKRKEDGYQEDKGSIEIDKGIN